MADTSFLGGLCPQPKLEIRISSFAKASHFALWATRDKSADYGGQRLFGLALRPIPKNELGGCPASLRYAVASGFEATIAA